MLMFTLTASVNAVETTTAPAGIEEVQGYVLYPNTYYYSNYYVQDRYINGVLCTAYWYKNCPVGGLTVLSKNGGGMSYVHATCGYYFVWVAY